MICKQVSIRRIIARRFNTSGQSLRHSTVSKLIFLCCSCSNKPVMLLIHKTWCGACKGQSRGFNCDTLLITTNTSPFVPTNVRNWEASELLTELSSVSWRLWKKMDKNRIVFLVKTFMGFAWYFVAPAGICRTKWFRCSNSLYFHVMRKKLVRWRINGGREDEGNSKRLARFLTTFSTQSCSVFNSTETCFRYIKRDHNPLKVLRDDQCGGRPLQIHPFQSYL